MLEDNNVNASPHVPSLLSAYLSSSRCAVAPCIGCGGCGVIYKSSMLYNVKHFVRGTHCIRVSDKGGRGAFKRSVTAESAHTADGLSERCLLSCGRFVVSIGPRTLAMGPPPTPSLQPAALCLIVLLWVCLCCSHHRMNESVLFSLSPNVTLSPMFTLQRSSC